MAYELLSTTTLANTSREISTNIVARQYTYKQLAGACCMILSYNVRKDFEQKYLTGRAGSVDSLLIKVQHDKVIWEHKPRKYDTAHYLRHKVVINEAGSYAQDLQEHGSRFLAYKKDKSRKKNFGTRQWERLNVQKVMIYRGNHKNYFGKSFLKMVSFLQGLGAEIQWNIH